MRVLTHKLRGTEVARAPGSAKRGRAFPGQGREGRSLLQLQHTIGNQAVGQLLRSNADGFEAGLISTESTHSARPFRRIPLDSTSRVTIQPKLRVTTPGDIYEQEADRVSELVLRMPEARLQPTSVRRGSCVECRTQPDEEQERLQTTRTGLTDLGASAIAPMVHDVVRSPGEPLDPAARVLMESRFGYDFSSVRVHSDQMAARSAETLGADAYTLGSDVVFAAGRYAPADREGRRLLAHELTHVVQQVPRHSIAPDTTYEQGENRGAAGRVHAHASLSCTPSPPAVMLQEGITRPYYGPRGGGPRPGIVRIGPGDAVVVPDVHAYADAVEAGRTGVSKLFATVPLQLLWCFGKCVLIGFADDVAIGAVALTSKAVRRWATSAAGKRILAALGKIGLTAAGAYCAYKCTVGGGAKD